jgi:hypothetical protein
MSPLFVVSFDSFDWCMGGIRSLGGLSYSMSRGELAEFTPFESGLVWLGSGISTSRGIERMGAVEAAIFP